MKKDTVFFDLNEYSGMMRKLFFTGFCSLLAWVSVAQEVIPLYSGPIPNSKPSDVKEILRADQGVAQVVLPTLSVYLPKEKSNGTAVIICPGGGYETLVMKREGYDIAETFNKMGIAAFVLKYRLPSEKTMVDPSVGPLQDAQQALKLIRQRAAEWHIDPKRIGIMGFSAGGHLAATAGTHFQKPVIDNPGSISLRPDFMILIYPVISLSAEIGSAKTRKNLLGESPSPEQLKLYSNELHVDKTTPPTFLTHAGDDSKVMVKNSIVFYETLQQDGVPADLHIYSKGEHGFGKTPAFEEWFGRIRQWMREGGWASPREH